MRRCDRWQRCCTDSRALHRRFDLKLSVLAFLDVSRFSVELPPDVLADLRTQIDKCVLASISNNGLVARPNEAVSRLANRLWCARWSSWRRQSGS